MWFELQFGLGSFLFPDKMKWINKITDAQKELDHMMTHTNGSWLEYVPVLKEERYQNAIKVFLQCCSTNFAHVMGNTTPQSVCHGDFHHWPVAGPFLLPLPYYRPHRPPLLAPHSLLPPLPPAPLLQLATARRPAETHDA